MTRADASTPIDLGDPPPVTHPATADGQGEQDGQGEAPDGGRPPARQRRESTGRRVARWTGDLVAIAVLVTVLWYFERHDGGFARRALTQGAVVALLSTPVAISEAARLPRPARWLLAAWGLGGLASLAFAEIRADAMMPTMTLGLLPFVFLSASRVWRRPWGPPVVLALLLASFGRYWHRSFLQWWGHTMQGSNPQWMALSWHNPSGLLMGAFGLLFLGAALTTRRLVAGGMALVAAAGFTGAWLSGSRGAVLVLVGAFAVTVAAGWRAHRDEPRAGRRLVATAGAVLLLTVAITGVLTAMNPTDGPSQPIAARDQSVSGNGIARLRHMQAAVGMLAADPLTGGGLGSYRTLALDHTPPNANLTSSAHNEYLEMLAEGGIVLGGAFAAAMLAAGLLALQRLRRPSPTDRSSPLTELRSAVGLGAVGVVAATTVHMAVDFDFAYPVVPSLLAIAVAVLVAERPSSQGPDARWRAGLVAVPVALLLAAGAGGASAEMNANQDQRDLDAQEYADASVPWGLRTNVSKAQQLAARGDHEVALSLLDRTSTWNPGSSRARTAAALIRFEQGEGSAESLVESLQAGRNRFDEFIAVAQQLIAADRYALADEVLDDVIDQLDSHRAWGVHANMLDALLARVRLEAVWHGCDAATEAAQAALADPATDAFDNGTQVVEDALAERCPTTG